MRSAKVIKIDTVLSVLIKIFIVVNLFIPYVVKINYRNCTFILSNLISLFLILILGVRKARNKYPILLIVLVFFYNLICFIYNYEYHNYYIEQFNKSISFILLIMLIIKMDIDYFIRNKIINFLIICINLTVVLSIIYYLSGGEAIVIENRDIIFRSQGYFEENRLTWIYGHKSTYGLMLIMFVSIIYRFRRTFTKKINYYISLSLIFIAILISASVTTIVALFIVSSFYYISNKKINKSYLMKAIIPFLIIAFIILLICVINYIGNRRDLTTLGSRTYIFNAARYNLGLYPNGIGKEFGQLRMSAEILMVENFHNIFLNEMLRFSINVGIIYFIIFVAMALFAIRKNTYLSIGIWISCFIIFNMDYSLRTEQLSIFLFLIYLTTMVRYDEDKLFHR